jgi:hypothetical protein
MKLINLIPLKEIDFRNQDQFDDYNKKHKLRPDTKVTIDGKPTTAGQAAKNSEPAKGTSVFGKDSGGSVFGKTGGEAPKSKEISNDDIEGLTSYKDFTKFYKANSDKLNKEDVPYIEDQMGALKYLESDYESGDVDTEELLVAYEELQDLIKKSMSSGSTKLSPMIPKSASGAKNKSITDIKVDTEVDVSTISKSILPNIRLGDGSGLPDKDAIELSKRLVNKEDGVYTRTSPHGGNIVFKDGTRFQVFRPHDAKKTKSTTIYASKR